MIEINESEQIARIVRKHWFVLLSDIFVLIAFVAIPVIAIFLFHFIPMEKFFSFAGSEVYVGSFFLFAWLLIVWMMGWNMWTDYYLDVLIITDKRIFDIDQKGLFRRTSSSFRIDKIQNVTVDQKGIIQTLLDFGTIRLETAGEREDFIASYIASPYEIKKFINNFQDREMERAKLVHLDNESD
ncbi:MAG: hypothetical protein UY04_C0014G0021 [Parcubacteria group bacterium GW2011_GWA2_47_7]|nr:MAG: hypothetical protein UY04_C0014G0021 [Parcubacteria group bacterium GW2011_GWA2_47_7]